LIMSLLLSPMMRRDRASESDMASARLSYEQEPAGIGGPFVGAASRTAVARATAAGPPWTNKGRC